jgi:site-specific DNA recombinase
VNVLSGAPYGYRYARKTDSADAYYEIIEAEAAVVRLVFEKYTREGLSINAIARELNEQDTPTRTGTTRWERSTVWAMLRNPAYRGRACFGKTEIRPRQRVTKPLRERNRVCSRNSANHEKPRQEWVEIPVPALVSEETFALAQEQLVQNKQHSPRRTLEPSLLQGMLVCERCGYSLYRTSTRTTARKLYYYRCIGSDAYRHLKGPVCDHPPVRQDVLDELVWTELMRLLEDPGLIEAELSRRVEAARNADPLKQREDQLGKDRLRLAKSIDRLLAAYQEDLMSLEELRRRVPDLRKQQQAIDTELASLETAATDRTQYVRLIETLAGFRQRVQARGESLSVTDRQKVLRLLVKEVLVGKQTITIRHSIRVAAQTADIDPAPTEPHPAGIKHDSDPGYLLRSGRNLADFGKSLPALCSRSLGEPVAAEEG